MYEASKLQVVHPQCNKFCMWGSQWCKNSFPFIKLIIKGFDYTYKQ